MYKSHQGSWTSGYPKADIRAITLIAIIVVIIAVLIGRCLYFCFKKCNSTERVQLTGRVCFVNCTIPSVDTMQPPKYEEVYKCPTLSEVPPNNQVRNSEIMECPPYEPPCEPSV
ncbi:hypothetical protein RF11_13733 [Thelohanellus kitauei]|uniref:Uncharacterized protein n=1 Tax=Thelohanellus kitauei TaxID=669202 RepID=A0A0C2MAA8_THEKT|nr:hypothetical protein RF11_13733 [Thelohanellus kitauei]